MAMVRALRDEDTTAFAFLITSVNTGRMLLTASLLLAEILKDGAGMGFRGMPADLLNAARWPGLLAVSRDARELRQIDADFARYAALVLDRS